MIRPPMYGETPLSPSEAAYLTHDYELPKWTPNSIAMNANAANGLHESEPSGQEQNNREKLCLTN